MKQVLFLVVSTFAVALGWEAGFRVRFGDPANTDDYGKEHFIALPKTVSEAKDQSWTQEQRVDKHLPSLTMLCHPSYVICVLYDDTEYVAGLQIAIPIDNVFNSSWDWDIQGHITWTPSNGKIYHTKQQYFVNEQYLSTSADERKANRNPNLLLSAGGSVWVSGSRGEIFEIQTKSDSLEAKGFTRENCTLGMGRHYYGFACDSEMFPFLALFDTNENLVGTGLMLVAKLPELKKDWFERFTAAEVKMIAPTAPQCVYDWAADPGFITIHIYYIDTPWLIDC